MAEAVEPSELRVGYKREEAGRLHADQGVGGSLHDQHGAGDPVEAGRDVEHGGQDGFLVGRGIGEVQQQLAGVLPGQLPGLAAFHGEEQAAAGAGRGHQRCDGC